MFEAKAAVAKTECEPHVAAIVRVERAVQHFQSVTERWTPSFEISFYLSSQPLASKTAAAAVRQHGGIENTSPYSRDVTFHEDASRIRKTPGVFARLRSFADNILKSNQTDAIPQDRLAAAEWRHHGRLAAHVRVASDGGAGELGLHGDIRRLFFASSRSAC